MSDQPPATTARLGRLIASYTPLPRSWAWDLKLALAASVVLMVGCWVVNPQHRWWWLLLGGLATLTCCLALFWRRRTSRRIDLYQQGLVWIVGRRRRMLSWNQIGEVYATERHGGWRLSERSGRGNSVGWRLVAHDGRQWRLKDFEGMGSLGSRIQTELIYHRLPSAMDAFRAGYRVRFGTQLSLSREGLTIGLKLLPWHEVNEIALDSTHGVRITCLADRVSRIQLRATQVPNLGLLAALLDAIQTGQSPQAPLDQLAQDELDRPVLVGDLEGSGCDPNDLLLAGYDWDDIQSVLRSDCTLEELLARGPRHRPRRPR